MLAATTRRAFASIPSSAAKAYSTATGVQISTASNGIKVAAIEEPGQTAGLSVIVNGGSRAENVGGAAHMLKNYGFKNTNSRSAFRITREAELVGGVLSANLTRETIAYSAEFLNSDAAQFAELLGDVVSNQKFQPHEFVDVAKQAAAESAAAAHSPEISALEAAHRAAFRTGLGNSVFADAHSRVSNDDVKQYAAQLFNTGNIALVGSGLSLDTVQKFAETYFNGVPAGSQVQTSATKYYGGEARVESNGANQYVLAFEGAPLNSTEYAAAQVLRFALGGERPVQHAAPSGLLGEVSAKFNAAEIKAFNVGYSDAGLFGVYVSGTSAEVASAVAAAAEQLKGLSKALSEADFARAVAQAKFAATAGFESRLDRLDTVGAQALLAGKYTSVAEAAAAIDSLSASDVAKVAEKLLSGKATGVAIGELYSLPYADSLSL
ncbi:Metalloenzyme, LuxS/M16 peptidase-like protein [Dichotomocladium elegans]|nr:Metalloenzyme, LuxS/M16 peptidase-like protein [Dichotomocladium elegans]